MRTSTDCISRVEECGRLAKLAAKPEDWQLFLEMAATWGMLAKQRPSVPMRMRLRGGNLTASRNTLRRKWAK